MLALAKEPTMYAITGVTGTTGAVVADTLLAASKPVDEVLAGLLARSAS